MAITQTIPTFPPAPNRATDTPEQFSSKADSQAQRLLTLPDELNAYAGQANVTATETNAASIAATGAANFRGTWSSATAYTVGQSVLFSGVVYTALTDNTNQTPPNATHWVLLADTISNNMIARQHALALSF